MYERMFLDEDKDVIFELADGQETAHKAILKASSDVFAGMFKHNMLEKTEGIVSLPDINRTTMRVFLRLIYTGHVDHADWAHMNEIPTSINYDGDIKLRQANVEVMASRLTSTGGTCWASLALLDIGDLDSFEFNWRSDNWSKMTVMVGIAPLDADLGPELYKRAGFYLYCFNGSITSLYAQDGTVNKKFTHPWPSPLPAGEILTLKFQHGILMFSVNGGSFVVAQFNYPIPQKVRYCPAVLFGNASMAIEVVSVPQPHPCPLDIMLSVASLAKKYMVSRVLSMVTHVLKRRLAHAKTCNDTNTFEQILTGAIAADMGAVRMSALDCAKEFAKLRQEYDAKNLRSETTSELEAIWPSPAKAVFEGQLLS